MYVTRTTFAATTAVMAAHVVLPATGCEKNHCKDARRRTIPGIFERHKVGSEGKHTQGNGEDDEFR